MTMNDFEKGMMAFDQNDYVAAYQCLLPSAEADNPIAQCRIAILYQAGLGVEPDGIMAVYWYRRAAEQRSMEGNISGLAYHNLSTIYVTGLPGVRPDRELAGLYLSRAKELGVDLMPEG